MRACPATSDLTVQFVKGGVLRLNAVSQPTPNNSTCMRSGCSVPAQRRSSPSRKATTSATLSSLAVRKLFVQLLRATPADRFDKTDTSKAIEIKRECEESRAYSQLSDVQSMMRNTRLELSPRAFSLSLHTVGECGWAKDGDDIELQCHDKNGCDMEDLSTTSDGKYPYNYPMAQPQLPIGQSAVVLTYLQSPRKPLHV